HIQGIPVLPRVSQPRGSARHHGRILREALAMKGRLQEMALALMQRAFAVEQALPEELFGDVPAAALQKGAVLPDEDRMQVLRMAEQHRTFRAEPEGDDIPIFLLEATHKAEHIAGERQQMGPGKAGAWPRQRRWRDHNQSFSSREAPTEHG